MKGQKEQQCGIKTLTLKQLEGSVRIDVIVLLLHRAIVLISVCLNIFLHFLYHQSLSISHNPSHLSTCLSQLRA